MTRGLLRGRIWLPAALALAAGLLLAGLASLPSVASALATQAGNGTLEGQVTNGTPEGAPIGAGITVTLHVYEGDTEVSTAQATTDTGGRFRFEGLDTATDLAYTVEAFYLGTGYAGPQPLAFQAGQTSLDAPITVYETTGDASLVSIDSGHIIAESLGPIMRVTEVYLFGNSGDRTYVGGLGEDGRLSTVRVPLPEGAVGLSFGQEEDAGRYIQDGGDLRDTTPVPPGQETMMIFVSYHLPVSGETIHVERSYDYPLILLNILLAQPGLSLQSDQMQSQGLQTFQDRQYALYTAAGLPAGSPLAFDLLLEETGVTAPTQPGTIGPGVTDRQGPVGRLGLVLAAAALAGVTGYALAVPPGSPGRPAALEGDPRAGLLLAAVADLDEAFEAGQMDEETYRRERAARLDAIRAL